MVEELITLKDIYSAVMEMKTDLARHTTRMEVMEAKSEQKDGELDDHEKRLRALEKWRYMLPTSALFAIGSAALTIFELLTHH